MLIIVSISCCCGARASHTLSTHTTQHLILRYVSYHRFCKHMCAQAITSRSITFATTRNTCAAKMSKIVSSLGHRAVLVSVECTRYTRALWRTLALYHGVQVTLRFWTFFWHLCLVRGLLIVIHKCKWTNVNEWFFSWLHITINLLHKRENWWLFVIYFVPWMMADYLWLERANFLSKNTKMFDK